MTDQTPWLLIDAGNTAIKWRLANAGRVDRGLEFAPLPALPALPCYGSRQPINILGPHHWWIQRSHKPQR